MKPLILCGLALALLAGCREDDVIICDPITATASFADLRAAAPAVQRFTFNLAQAQSFRTRDGATVAFGPNAFILPNGTVATGQAELRLREIYSVPNMVLADMPTTAASSRQVLISGGEFNLQVWQGSTRLRLAAFSLTSSLNRLTLTSPVPPAGLDTTRMQLWQQPISPLAGTPRDSVGWQLASAASPSPTSNLTPIRVPANAGYYTAVIPLDSIGHWNIDQFWYAYRTNATGYVGVEVPSASAATTTRVYFRPVGYNGLARGVLRAGSTSRWQAFLPRGVDVVAVVLQEQNGQLYYGTQRLTTAAGTVVAPSLQALSLAEVVQRIRQL